MHSGDVVILICVKVTTLFNFQLRQVTVKASLINWLHNFRLKTIFFNVDCVMYILILIPQII